MEGSGNHFSNQSLTPSCHSTRSITHAILILFTCVETSSSAAILNFRRQKDTHALGNRLNLHSNANGWKSRNRLVRRAQQMKRKTRGTKHRRSCNIDTWVYPNSAHISHHLAISINHRTGKVFQLALGADTPGRQRLTEHESDAGPTIGKFIFTHEMTTRCSPYYCLFILGKLSSFSPRVSECLAPVSIAGGMARWVVHRSQQEQQTQTDSPAEAVTTRNRVQSELFLFSLAQDFPRVFLDSLPLGHSLRHELLRSWARGRVRIP